jgi:hypothetical protein
MKFQQNGVKEKKGLCGWHTRASEFFMAHKLVPSFVMTYK